MLMLCAVEEMEVLKKFQDVFLQSHWVVCTSIKCKCVYGQTENKQENSKTLFSTSAFKC